ncbi:shikimate O-hydroxycinnamoyltransferase [Cannabis sativa]|jgi:shikimate O-hydroxycinnamoyltransferase|uniref:shikimate O-hydroxycinnamoyltransferase n=1 Tax=Cannabis sativa TaxID=3483 RepID=UPI0029CA5801|nr:shikimate O-hydroxycinnamoyltransferase [Cannabis sativa]
MELTIEVKKTTMVKPAAATPRHVLWNSNVDQLVPRFLHVSTVYFYKPKQTHHHNFFDSNILKEALSKVLVPFYPVAGRLVASSTESGRVDIDCNGEGVLFVEAETNSLVDDFGDFKPSPKLKSLVPSVEYSKGISSYPLLLVQITYFKCGGVSIGVAIEHHVIDGVSAIHFLNSWSDIASGIEQLKTPPFLDRTILCAHNPPTPIFDHVEYESPLTKKTTTNDNIDIAIYKLSNEQLKTLKANCVNNEEEDNKIKYSSYEILAGHIWRCACKARKLSHDQETKLYVVVDGRSRLQPPLPPGYFGNAIFTTTTKVKAGDLVQSKSWYAAKQIRSTLKRIDDSYLRSALDYLELQPDLSALSRGSHTFRSPNLGINSWIRLPFYEADFGWGRPIYVRPATILYDGITYLLSSPDDDGSVFVAIGLQHDHMKDFVKFLYDI